MHTIARLLFPGDPLLQLPPKPTGFDALYAEKREWREDRLAEHVEARLLDTRFGDLFTRGEADRPLLVEVGWTEGSKSPALVVQLAGPIGLPMAESIARALSAEREVRVRGVTVVGGDSSPISVGASSSSRWERGNEVSRKDTRDAAASRVQRRFRSGTGIAAEAVAEWLLEDDSIALVDALTYRPSVSR